MKQVSALLALVLGLSLTGCAQEAPPALPEEPVIPAVDELLQDKVQNDAFQFPLPELSQDGPAPWEEWDELEPQSPARTEEPVLAPAESAVQPVPDTAPDPDSDSGGTATDNAQQPQAAAIQAEEAPEEQQPAPVGPAVEQEAAVQQPAATQAPTLSTEAIELELFRLVNQEREAAGLPALGMEDAMRWAARMRAPEALDSLSHIRPDGTPYYTAFDEAGFVYAGKWHGENVSTMFFPTGTYTAEAAAQKMFEALKDSSGHYQNMLSENFDQAGIGVAIREENGTTYLASAQLFSSF